MSKFKIPQIVIGLIALISPLSAQSPSSWHGLTLDESTIEDARSILGEGKHDRGQRLRTAVDDWLNTDLRMDRLEFENVEDLDKVRLWFLEGMLAAIELDLDEGINPNALPDAYGVEFTPKVAGLQIASNPSAYERNQGKVYPKNYPNVYDIIGVAEQAFVIAQIEQGSISSFLGELGGIEDTGGSFPGEAKWIWLVSRSLEDKRNLDVLE